jgi:hypothetical protein
MMSRRRDLFAVEFVRYVESDLGLVHGDQSPSEVTG